MNVLGINGSPHPEGNSAYALRYALEILEAEGIETLYLSLAEMDIKPCSGNFECRSGTCIHDDDMRGIHDALRKCHGLILASPVYLGMISGQMKVMMDRTVLLRASGQFELSGKVGGGITCGGARNGGQELSLQCMHTFFLQQDMFAISDGPRGSHSGAAIVGKAFGDESGLKTVENLAKRMVRALHQLHAGSQPH